MTRGGALDVRLLSPGLFRFHRLVHRCGSKAFQGVREDSGHVHLGDADLFGDFRLRHLREEAEIQDSPFAVGQVLDGRRDRRPPLDQLDRRVAPSDRLLRATSLFADRGIE